MQSVSWLSFCVSNAVTRTSVHFFPCADNVTAPYPANCTMTLFGSGVVARTITLEGGRLSNPDGLRLDDAFPELKSELNGIFGLAIELTTPQPRLDLRSSSCVIEFMAHGLPARFWPCTLARSEGASPFASARERAAASAVGAPAHSLLRSKTAIALKDPVLSASLVVVNGSPATARVLCEPSASSVTAHVQRQFLVEVPAQGVQEVVLQDSFYEGCAAQECSWGNLKARALTLCLEIQAGAVESTDGQPEPASSTALSTAVASYIVYRDAASRRIASVLALGG